MPVSTRVITGPVSTVLITFLGFSGSKSYVYTCQQEISDVAKYVFCLPALFFSIESEKPNSKHGKEGTNYFTASDW